MIGHGYWQTVAIASVRKQHDAPTEPSVSLILQRCTHCGKYREARMRFNWSDYADSVYDETVPGREVKA